MARYTLTIHGETLEAEVEEIGVGRLDIVCRQRRTRVQIRPAAPVQPCHHGNARTDGPTHLVIRPGLPAPLTTQPRPAAAVNTEEP